VIVAAQDYHNLDSLAETLMIARNPLNSRQIKNQRKFIVDQLQQDWLVRTQYEELEADIAAGTYQPKLLRRHSI
jgi:hypothetical protein